MIRLARVSLLAVGATAAAALPLVAQSADPVIDRAVAAWAKVRTVHATFEQTISNPLTGTSATAEGEFDEQRPNKLSIRFTNPEGDRIVSDGKSVWLYLPSSAPGRVIKRSALGASATPIDFTGEFLNAPRSKYRIADAGQATVEGHGAHVLALTPKPDTDAPFTKATVWVDDDDALIRQFEVVEPSGVTRRIRITSLELNAPVSSRTFSFTPPSGVRVVDQTNGRN